MYCYVKLYKNKVTNNLKNKNQKYLKHVLKVHD